MEAKEENLIISNKVTVHYENIIRSLESQFKQIEADRQADRLRVVKLETKLEEKEKTIHDKELEFRKESDVAKQNIIKLESKLEEREKIILEKEKAILEKEKIIIEKDQEIKVINREKDEIVKLTLLPKQKKSQSSYNDNDINKEECSDNPADEQEKIVKKVVKVEWTTLIWISTKLKFWSFFFSIIVSLFVTGIVSLFTGKDWGIINIISRGTSSNQFYLSLVTARLMYYPVIYFLIGKDIQDYYIMLYYSTVALFWVAISILNRMAFPSLTGLYYLNGVEAFPPANERPLIFILLIFSNYISEVIGDNVWSLLIRKILVKLSPNLIGDALESVKESMKRSSWVLIKKSIVRLLILNFLTWFQILIIILIGSMSEIPKLDPNIEVFLFGYAMPVVKASVITILYNRTEIEVKKASMSKERIAKVLSGVCAAGTCLCTISQLYVVMRNANNYSFFCAQYLPHEIIKKLSWLTFHPSYLEFKLQIKQVLKNMYSTTCKTKEKVNPIVEGNLPKKARRFSIEVKENMNATAGEMVGRQFGEDVTMILIATWMLPISQEYMFAQIYPSSDSLPFPIYESVGTMILGVAFGFETVLTISCFAILQRVGVPLASNASALEFHRMTIGMYTFSAVSWLLVLAATFIY